MQGKRVLVTGGAGFIGSHIVDRLIGQEHEVIILDDLSTGKEEYLNPKAKFYRYDISNGEKINSFFKGVEEVYHVAGLARIQPSFDNPNRYFEVNAIGTRNVLMAAKEHGVRRVVYSASSSAYGDSNNSPLQEDFKVTSQALHPYGSTKRMGEMLMRDLGKVTGGPETVCLRYFNVYGPRQTTSKSDPYPTVIGIFCDLLNQNKPLTVVPDGYQRRDFTAVSDIVEANLLAMKSQKVGMGEIINVGTGVNHSIWEIVSFMLGVDPNTTPDELLTQGKCVVLHPRRGEVKETLADIIKARELFSYEPQLEFYEGLKQVMRWSKENNNKDGKKKRGVGLGYIAYH